MAAKKTKAADFSKLTLEEAFSALDMRVSQLNDNTLSLEDAFTLYQEGMQLVKLCGEKIDLVDKQVMMISEDGLPTGELPPMNDQGAENR